MFYGQNYYNIRQTDFKITNDFKAEILNRDKIPRTPWKDFAIEVRGSAVKSLGNHFINCWNNYTYELNLPDQFPIIKNKANQLDLDKIQQQSMRYDSNSLTYSKDIYKYICENRSVV